MLSRRGTGHSGAQDSIFTFLFLLVIIANALIITDLFLSILRSPATLVLIRVVLMLVVLGFLLSNGLRHQEIRGRGWTFILTGFCLLFLSSLIDLLARMQLTSGAFSLISRPVLNFLENIFFDLMGYFCLAYGFFLWIPSIIEARRRISRTAGELERVVAERTRTLQEINEQLFRNKLDLEKANRLKNEFLASVSHELKTPLNSILGFCRLLLDGRQGSLDARQIKSIQVIDSNSKTLLDQINRILDYARIEFERVRLDIRSVDVAGTLGEVIQTMEPLARAKGLSLDLDTSGGPGTALTDPKLLRQLLLGILDNALKFTDHGGVRVTTAKEPPDRWIVCVSDTGIGIPEQDMPHIFDAFRQGDGSLSRRYGGTGLGLTIARRLANFLNGTITVESRPGEGSTFIISLPAQTLDTVGSGGLSVNMSSENKGYSEED